MEGDWFSSWKYASQINFYCVYVDHFRITVRIWTWFGSFIRHLPSVKRDVVTRVPGAPFWGQLRWPHCRKRQLSRVWHQSPSIPNGSPDLLDKIEFWAFFAVVWNLACFLAKMHFFMMKRESPDHLDLQSLASLHWSTYEGLSSSVRYVKCFLKLC